MKLRLELDDGRTLEADANTRTFACLADRVAFEHTFKTSAAVMGHWEHLFDPATGSAKEGADLSGLREEWITFLFWRELRRRVENVPSWDDVLEHAVEFTVVGEDAEPNGLDPTTPTPS